MNDEALPTHQLRDALRNIAQPVTVLLVRDELEVRGATLSSFMSVSIEPQCVAVSISRARWLHEALPVGARCSISLLAAGQEYLADHFSSAPTRAHGVHTVRLAATAAGTPCCPDSLAVLDCTVQSQQAVGDHSLLVLAVFEVAIGDAQAEPLLWRRSAYTYPQT